MRGQPSMQEDMEVGGVKPACRRAGVGLCLECLPASEWKVTPQEKEKEGGFSLQAHTHCGLVLA